MKAANEHYVYSKFSANIKSLYGIFFYCWQKIAFRYNIAEKSSPLAYFNLKFAILKCLKVVLGHILLLNACYINWGFFCSMKYIVLAQHLTKY